MIPMNASTPPKIKVVVTEKRKRSSSGVNCVIGEDITFNEHSLLTYCFAEWKPIIFDMLVVAAAVEFCDRHQRRPAYAWSREFDLEIPVHEKARWEKAAVKEALIAVLSFLTGDKWSIHFVDRKTQEAPRVQSTLPLPTGVCAVVPFSDGMDSRSVAALSSIKYGDKITRIRLGTKKHDQPKGGKRKLPFMNVPYKVKGSKGQFIESSNRSRGFKFSLIAGIAAYLSNADTIVMPESGQGALVPALIPVVQAYPDYRNHPRFTAKMEDFLSALLGHRVSYEFPRLWFTKGETLKAFVTESDERDTWDSTISCWQQNRHVSVDGHRRQCGICAACLLRRMSVHAAGLSESNKRYVWEDLTADSFEAAAPANFTKITGKLREYAIAGVMHLDHLAGLVDSDRYRSVIRRNASQIAPLLGISTDEAEAKFLSLLKRHKNEWCAFVDSLGSQSFIRQWAASLS